MKHIILILVFAIGFGVLHAQENKSKRQIRKAKKEAEYSKRVSEVKDLIDRKEYKFVATQMLPSGALSQHLSYGYDLTISDNKITCYLP